MIYNLIILCLNFSSYIGELNYAHKYANVSDPSRLQEEMTRYHVYLQVKKDLAEGRLAGAPFSTICLLTSYAAQVCTYANLLIATYIM